MNRLAVVLFIIVGLLALGPCVFTDPAERPRKGEGALEPVSWRSPDPVAAPELARPQSEPSSRLA